jgi:hypothetical protein
VEKTAALCSEWVAQMLKLICLDDINLQSFFDLLLSEGEYWPLLLKPCLQNGHASVKVQLEPAITDDIVRVLFSVFFLLIVLAFIWHKIFK